MVKLLHRPPEKITNAAQHKQPSGTDCLSKGDLSLLKRSISITIVAGGGALQWIHHGVPKQGTLCVAGLSRVSVLNTSHAGYKRRRMLRVVTCRLRRTLQATARLEDRPGFCPTPPRPILNRNHSKRSQQGSFEVLFHLDANCRCEQIRVRCTKTPS